METEGSLQLSQQPLVAVLMHIDPIHALQPWPNTFNIILSSTLGLPSGFFPSAFPTKPAMNFYCPPYMLYAP
jgi:hypothetical protein